MSTSARISWLALLIIGIVAPVDGTAGGGGGGNKLARVVRILNDGAVDPGAPLLGIETVEIGDPNNAPATVNSTSIGQVSAAFRMAKFEVTIADYVVFLNAVATRADGGNGAIIESLYDTRMGSDGAIAGITRSGSGSAGAPYAYAVVGDGKKPISYVSWFSAARFANWMHNGATATADIENGAYTFNGVSDPNVVRNGGAKWWIPSQDEWFKAAYYKGGSTNAGYWKFPSRSDSLPENASSAGENQANFLRLGVFSVTQGTTLDPAQNYLTAVGTFTNSPSPYGTLDQGGNVEEWTDTGVSTGFGFARITRGGAWNSGGLNNDVDPVPTGLPNDRLSKVGFRLARESTGSGGGAALSGTFVVRIGGETERSQTIGPGQIAQFSVRQGSFTVFAADAANPSSSREKTLSTASNRQTFVTVKKEGSEIAIAAAAPGRTF